MMTALPNNYYSGHLKAIEEDGDQSTPETDTETRIVESRL